MLNKSYRNWIIDATFSEAASAINLPIRKLFINDGKTTARDRFVDKALQRREKEKNVQVLLGCHRMLKNFGGSLDNSVWQFRNSRVLVTHLAKEEYDTKLVTNLRGFDKLLCYNSEVAAYLLKIGFNHSRVQVIGGGVDRRVFFPQDKEKVYLPSNAYTLICGDVKPRKRPELIFEVVRSLPELSFVFHGVDWRQHCPKDLRQRSNLRFHDFRMKNQPELMRNANLYLNLSENEGGPFSTLEALVSGTPVVVTKTGWNSEYVSEKNGHVLTTDSSVGEIVWAIKQAINLKEKIRNDDQIIGRALWTQVGERIYN